MLNNADVNKTEQENITPAEKIASVCLSMQLDLEEVHEFALCFAEIAFESYEKELQKRKNGTPDC